MIDLLKDILSNKFKLFLLLTAILATAGSVVLGLNLGRSRTLVAQGSNHTTNNGTVAGADATATPSPTPTTDSPSAADQPNYLSYLLNPGPVPSYSPAPTPTPLLTDSDQPCALIISQGELSHDLYFKFAAR